MIGTSQRAVLSVLVGEAPMAFPVLTASEIAREAGLTRAQANAAIKRCFNRGLIFLPGTRSCQGLAYKITSLGLKEMGW